MTELSFGVIPNIDFHLAPEALVVTDLFAFCADRDDAPQGADFIKGFLQGIFHPFTFGDVDKADDRPFDHIVDGAVGVNAHRVPQSLDRLHIFLLGGQVIQHGLNISNQVVIPRHIRDDMTDGPPHIGLDQVDDPGKVRGETEDAQPVIDKDRTDAGAGHHIVHVVVRSGQIRDIALQFGIDRGQFLVGRLEFFLGGS